MNSTIGDIDSQRDYAGSDQNDVNDSREATICVVGLGYVGLPLAVGFDQEGYNVVGFDIDDGKVETLRGGIDTTGDLGDDAIAESEITYTNDPEEITRADYVMITVPTPVDEHDQPNLDFVKAAGRTVGDYMSPDTTVILESTVFPGATREALVPAIEEASGLTCGEDFFVGYSPERATPGDPEHGLRDVVKVVGGMNDDVRDDIAELYSTVIDAGVHKAASLEVAEASKVVENVQRDLNIALVNELAMAFDNMDMDIDTRAVLEAAGTKWNFHDYRPGLVGGHCIPVDPYFFIHRSKQAGFSPNLIQKGRDVNESMPAHVSNMMIKELNQAGKALRDSRVLILGMTYKPDVADIRTSKVDGIIRQLREFDIETVGYDPHGDNDLMGEKFGIPILEDEEFSVEGFDGIVLATPHHEFYDLDLAELAAEMNDDPCFVDVTGSFKPEKVTDAGFAYRRV
ncbi:nucleotide sugar dehydrogenase [Haladaptatus paucihalophilus DX253]|uniref:UDP-N-acetyl-D-mannosamine dehydrogenase n=1 Tax=Haladaptatus paucihalophilus DX253 TaxID=797209 RepID=E7QW51_HALPU|nr:MULTISPECIES: nucleotide sugar dehydrogenase [Haladaptatus]EFW91185.1 nucleotide sugar dehydrogenase [Haladaptatus paucihalophilus DX253]GKZ16345.1 UDP-N-acetyl-D-galactosamine dehydrogenase [Haladaptatus sp. T7]SHL64643.1 UDP-N-acetyl-D-galactosamine dehydrogenase [Haladaptatus paucihalophilus DX253]